MKKVFSVVSMMALIACLMQGYTRPAIANKNDSRFSIVLTNRLKWQNSTWVNPFSGNANTSVRMLVGSYFVIVNQYDNVVVNYLAVGTPTHYGSGTFPVYNGDQSFIISDLSGVQSVYVGVSLSGPPVDGQSICFANSTGDVTCQPITASGEYVFSNVQLTPTPFASLVGLGVVIN